MKKSTLKRAAALAVAGMMTAILQAKSGKKKGYLIEGMGCPGGCVAGAGTNIPVVKAQIQVKKFVEEAEDFVPPETAQY